jgi:hypothetical protein
MSTIFHSLLRFIAFSTFSLYTAKKQIFEFYNVQVLKQHRKFELHKVSEWSDSRKIAVVALFPRRSILDSALRLVDQLISNEYQVVAVINSQTKFNAAWLFELEQRDITIILRPNIGRDFGAYQAGIRYIQSSPSYKLIDRLVIANDSVYYFPDSRVFLDNLLAQTSIWVSMYVNFQFHLHAQSFFESFSSEVFLDENFISFWKRYKPTDIRHNVIRKGEVELTRRLIKAGFTPKAYVSPELIESSLKFKNFTAQDKFALWSGFAFSDFDSDEKADELHSLKLKIIFATQNPTHHAALLATRTLGAPLKLDLFRTGLASLSDILELSKRAGLVGNEFSEFENEISSKGSQSSATGIKKMWRRFGYE